jgi:Ser/Thr protein kinase RdoA (MazF antagonist)
MNTIEDQVYQFETVFETAIAQVLASQLFTVYTPSNDEFLTEEFTAAHPDLVPYLPNGQEFQKHRPRIEAVFVLGAGKGHLHIINPKRKPVSGSMPETSYNARIEFAAVTESKAQIHRAYLAKLRRNMDTIREALNETSHLQYHSIQQLRPSGSSSTYQTEDGYYETGLVYELDFCIRQDAWTALSNP